MTKEEAKFALDILMEKSRVHFYKPIQVAEILYRNRVYRDIDLLRLEDYRTKSKKWRDEICEPLLGRKCSSSSKFQDDLFNNSAIPPKVLKELGDENNTYNGAVEAYIYNCFFERHKQLNAALNYCKNNTRESFNVIDLINSFWNEPGLRRSIDKIYEIVVYSLFSSLVEVIDFKIEISVSAEKMSILEDFEDFSKKVMSLDIENPTHVENARVYRVGITNAADRGLDMYSNWGPAIQIKHLCLDASLAENIVSNISSDKVIIVCKDVERDVILSLLTQIGWTKHIQSIVTESDLSCWYEKALRGKYSNIIGDNLLSIMQEEIEKEFPSLAELPQALVQRHYNFNNNPFWKNKKNGESNE